MPLIEASLDLFGLFWKDEFSSHIPMHVAVVVSWADPRGMEPYEPASLLILHSENLSLNLYMHKDLRLTSMRGCISIRIAIIIR